MFLGWEPCHLVKAHHHLRDGFNLCTAGVFEELDMVVSLRRFCGILLPLKIQIYSFPLTQRRCIRPHVVMIMFAGEVPQDERRCGFYFI